MRHQENFQDLRKKLFVFLLSGMVALLLHMWIHQSSEHVRIVSTERFNGEQLERSYRNDCAYRKVIEKRNDECKRGTDRCGSYS